MIPLIRTNGSTQSREKHPQSIRFPPPCFTVGTWYRPSYEFRLNLLSSLRRTLDHSESLHCPCSLANASRSFRFFTDMSGLLAGRLPCRPKFTRRRFTVETCTSTSNISSNSFLIDTAERWTSLTESLRMSRSVFSVVISGRPLLVLF